MTGVAIVYAIWGFIVFLVPFTLVLRRICSRKLAEIDAEVSAALATAMKEPMPIYDTYGHPWMPIPELKAELPKAPLGHAWEITAVLNGANNPALRLGLLDLGEGEVIVSAERDMVVIRRWQYAEDDTFAVFYRRAKEMYANNVNSAVELARKIFETHLISPLVDWANAEVTRKAVTEPPALTTNYALVESA
jgi:hypothetical protein